jgi:hypothetical protein
MHLGRRFPRRRRYLAEYSPRNDSRRDCCRCHPPPPRDWWKTGTEHLDWSMNEKQEWALLEQL